MSHDDFNMFTISNTTSVGDSPCAKQLKFDATAAEHINGIRLLEASFDEDLGPEGEDATTVAVSGREACGDIVARQSGVVCGISVLVRMAEVRELGADVDLVDGSFVTEGDRIMRLTGDAANILTAERNFLNLLQRLSGTATLTREFVNRVAGTKARIFDTRKTTPGMRHVQRWAVRCGGGFNHRFGLFDEAMIKDNHIDAVGITQAVGSVRFAHRGIKIHVEVRSFEELREALAAKASVIMLDNMSLDDMRKAVEIVQGSRVEVEASGGINLETVRDVALTGVDRISVGALTHSAPAFDCALDLSISDSPAS